MLRILNTRLVKIPNKLLIFLILIFTHSTVSHWILTLPFQNCQVGLAFDKHNVLWGVENSADRLRRNDIGGDIHNQNPAEELNRFLEEDKGKHWGYPYCWTEFDLGSYRRFGAKPKGRGTPWAWPSFKVDGKPNDGWCLNNTVRPIVSLQAHSAPLGITFCKLNVCNTISYD